MLADWEARLHKERVSDMQQHGLPRESKPDAVAAAMLHGRGRADPRLGLGN